MDKRSVLIVDDEKNIRLTLAQALESLDLDIDTAINGEDALQKLEEKGFDLVLLDLKMPGMSGMEVLQKLRVMRPDIRVVIITAHGTIDSAVEAMRLGAVDFIQKPFSPGEIRSIVAKVLDREHLVEQQAMDYNSNLELGKKYIWKHDFAAAEECVRKAIALDPSRPEGFNFLGTLLELSGELDEARRHYRAALSLNPSYEPARQNLSRLTSRKHEGTISLGEIPGPQPKKEE